MVKLQRQTVSAKLNERKNHPVNKRPSAVTYNLFAVIFLQPYLYTSIMADIATKTLYELSSGFFKPVQK